MFKLGLRRLLPVVAAAAASLALAGTASAHTITSSPKTVGDCTLTAQLQDYSGPVARGDAWLQCGQRHVYSQVQVIVKRESPVDGSIFQAASPLVTYTNSFGLGSTDLSTPNVSESGGWYWQAVATANVAGLGSWYVTTGAPIGIIA
jgi:hypothetical protein